MINHQLLLIWVKAEITDFYASNAKDAKCLPPVIRACKWVTIHGVTPRDWSLLGTKRD